MDKVVENRRQRFDPCRFCEDKNKGHPNSDYMDDDDDCGDMDELDDEDLSDSDNDEAA